MYPIVTAMTVRDTKMKLKQIKQRRNMKNQMIIVIAYTTARILTAIGTAAFYGAAALMSAAGAAAIRTANGNFLE